jgi:hypothetical protein
MERAWKRSLGNLDGEEQERQEAITTLPPWPFDNLTAIYSISRNYW